MSSLCAVAIVIFQAVVSASHLSSLSRYEDRPDFKKVEESMRSYHNSISNKDMTEGAAAAAEPVN